MKQRVLLLATALLAGCSADATSAPASPDAQAADARATDTAVAIPETATPNDTTVPGDTTVPDDTTTPSDTLMPADTSVTDTAAVDAGPPGGCGAPIVLDPASISPAAFVDTTTVSDMFTLSCGGGGRDAVFKLTLPTKSKVKLTATNSDFSITEAPIIAVRRSCSDATSEVSCAALESELTLDAGVYYVLVDTDRTATTMHTLRAQITPIAECTAATPLTFVSNVATASGDTSTSKHYAIGCDTFAAPDKLYSFELTSVQRVTATLTGKTSGYQPALSLRSNCDDPTTMLACQYMSTPVEIKRTLAPGKYALFVDGMMGTSGAYDLTVRLDPPVAGDVCANPIPLTFTGGTATHSGVLSDAADDYSAGCGGAYADKVHSFTITTPSRVEVSISKTTSSGTSPMVFLRTTCADPYSQISCRGWAEPKPTIGYAVPGMYYAIVDSIFSSTTGAYKLDVTTSTPLAGESCENAEPLALATTISDSTAGYGHDMGPGAYGFDGQGPDRVWTFTETTTKTRTVTFSTPALGWTGNVFVQQAPCKRERVGIMQIENKNDGKPVTGTFMSTAGTTYYVVVDTRGTVTAGGGFTLRVE